MTPHQLSALATQGSAVRANKPSLRVGQAQWIALELAHPKVADRLRAGPADCFYDDDNIPAFFAAVIEEDA